ncbi:MAG: glutaredoxin family protein [Algicola sp.]|nr:glutaredoxin family protein [Algicola sp.]
MKMKTFLEFLIIGLICAGGGYGYTVWQNSSDVDFDVQTGDYSEYGINETNNIVIYTRDGCPACKELKEYLSERQVTYHEVVTNKDEAGRAKLTELGFNFVPVVIVQNTLIPGFQQEELDKALALLK